MAFSDNGFYFVKLNSTFTYFYSQQANGDIYAEEKSALPSDGELELTLTLDKVTTDQDGQRLICEASTSYPPEQSTARQYTEISVNCE